MREPQEPRGRSVESPREGAEGCLGGLGGRAGSVCSYAAGQPAQNALICLFIYLFCFPSPLRCWCGCVREEDDRRARLVVRN